MSSLITKQPRLEVVDALRGFAVMAILLLHCLEHFLYFTYPATDNYPMWLGSLDKGVHTFFFALFAGKSYAIFALLFGLTFFIQQKNQQLQGRDFGYRFLWRLLLLAGFATLNALIFPGGDVLMLFVVTGIVLFITRNMKSKTVLIIAIIFLLQPLDWILYLCGVSVTNQLNGPMYGVIQGYIANGDFIEFVKNNLWFGQKTSLLWAVENGRAFQTVGLFLLGMVAGRSTIFTDTDKSQRFWRYTLIICAIAYAPLLALSQLSLGGNYAGVALDMWQKLAFTGVLVASFTLLYFNLSRFRSLCTPLKCYGRMSLTNYLTQSYLGALIFMPFGLNLAPACGAALSVVVGIGIFSIQLAFSKWWLNHHKIGPLEWVWHKLTWIAK